MKKEAKKEFNKEDLLYIQKNGWERSDAKKNVQIHAFSDGYKAFLDDGKTEREVVSASIALLKKAGFCEYKQGQTLKAGDKIYQINRQKAIAAAVIGSCSPIEGMRICAAHIDSPRIDLKPNPLYESKELCYFKTHYYGGVKKYQWAAIPLDLLGVVVLQDGTSVRISTKELENPPVFTITDLLPHLAKDQVSKPASEFFPGENLNILIGSVPYDGECTDRVKLAILSILNEQYNLRERDFLSAEISAVPAFDAGDVGFDRSMVGAYGQDDRVCAYTALQALLQLGAPIKTAVCFLADKEETGSDGVTGLQSFFFDTFITNICELFSVRTDLCMQNSTCLSCDVANAFDPNFQEVSDERNNAKMNYGVAVMKYTGARGKAGTSEATAEFMASVCALFDKENITWQIATLGKVDQGGGGTVAAYLARRNIDTIDVGVPVLSMHAPFEVAAKLDIYMAYLAVKAYYEEKK